MVINTLQPLLAIVVVLEVQMSRNSAENLGNVIEQIFHYMIK